MDRWNTHISPCLCQVSQHFLVWGVNVRHIKQKVTATHFASEYICFYVAADSAKDCHNAVGVRRALRSLLVINCIPALKFKSQHVWFLISVWAYFQHAHVFHKPRGCWVQGINFTSLDIQNSKSASATTSRGQLYLTNISLPWKLSLPVSNQSSEEFVGCTWWQLKRFRSSCSKGKGC